MKCPKCQHDIPAADSFCRKCGAKAALNCPKCGAEASGDDQFCGKCGSALKETREDAPIHYKEPKSYTPKFLAEKILTTRSSIEGERRLGKAGPQRIGI